MTSPLRRGLGALAVTAALLPFVTTCDSPPPPHQPGAIALVVGGRSNMPKPLLVKGARQLTRDAALSKDTLYIVGVSGRPELLYTEDITHRCNSDTACDGFADAYLDKIDRLLDKVAAEVEEADTLGAILAAAALVNRVKTTGPKQILVIDSGLQTVGDIQLQSPGALSVTADDLVEQFKGTDSLKPLAGVHVLLTGLGSSHTPQERLPAEAVSRLTSLWTGLLSSGGAVVESDPSPLGDAAPAASLPKVAVVLADEVPKLIPTQCARFREDQIGFLPDQAVFRDPAKAREVLAPIAEQLKLTKVAATVIGTTALPETSLPRLSTVRAQVVVDILVGLGVPDRSLTPVGVGINFGGYDRTCVGPTGVLNRMCAVKNRLVIVQPVGISC